MDGDLHVTCVFELFRQLVEEGSEADWQRVAQYEKMSKMAVHSTIAVIRKMAAAGEIAFWGVCAGAEVVSILLYKISVVTSNRRPKV